MKYIIGILLLSIAGTANAFGDDLYLSPSGNDAWSGSLPEANAAHSDGPLATLDKARMAVRARIAKGLTSPITVQVRGGEYALDKTVVFGPEDAGTKTCPLPCEKLGIKPLDLSTAGSTVHDSPTGGK